MSTLPTRLSDLEEPDWKPNRLCARGTPATVSRALAAAQEPDHG